MLKRLHALLFGSLRRQLVWGVALTNALLMALFAWVSIERQMDVLHERQSEYADALAQSIATSSAGWLAARDYSGLQEIVLSQRRYPELLFAMILDNSGRILAHSDPARLNQYVLDLPQTTDHRPALIHSEELVDLTLPAMLGKRQVGWVRVGLGLQTAQARTRLLALDGLIYAVIAICIGSLLAAMLGWRLTRRLYAIQAVSNAVQTGDSERRVGLAGVDEAARLGRAFDAMLDALALRDQALQQSEVQHRRHLEELVQDRTEQLVQARDAAESANRAKSTFLSNMSHELRTPLNAILGFAQLMEQDERLPPDARHNIETINRAGRHLLSLINDVLEISRIETGHTTIQNAAFDLPDTIKSVEEMIRVRAEYKGLAFTVAHVGELPLYVDGDAHHLRQVLINLLGNAVKYTDQGGVWLRMQPVGDSIRFDVGDSGPGIAPDEQTRIFQPFYQTESGIAKGEGTGLGLAISHEFVHLMGGELSVASNPGQGSVFSFTLPLPETTAPACIADQRLVLHLAPDQPPVRILVAEDNADNQELIARLLEKVGFEVRLADNGQRAVEIFQSWRPHFIWMDMRMPVMDGYQATQAIRALSGGESVKIVALTASAFRENRAAILAAGCDDMQAKPLDANRLYAQMGDLLGLRYRYADATPAAAPEAPAGGRQLQDLPEALRNELMTAAELLDPEAVHAIVERMLADYPEQARQVDELAGEYRFDRVAELCRGA
ncbi:MAG: response regulator [Methylococcaceae bacterium]|nr:MAG: response regulator [Methylococcaceae bacterium]